MLYDIPFDEHIRKIFLETTHDIQSISHPNLIYRAISLDELSTVIRNAMDEGYDYGLKERPRILHDEVTV